MMSTSRRINWKDVIEAMKIELEYFSNEGYKPTLRTMFYRLYSKQMIPNTINSYNRLSKVTVEARWNGTLEMDCFADNSRKVIGDFNEDYYTPQHLIEGRIALLKDTKNDYKEYIPRWYNQPNYVEVWIEKDAMASTFQSILESMEVRIVPNKGFASMTFLYETVNRLNRILERGKKAHILYYGDFDPSGDYMVTDLKQRMVRFGLDLEFNYCTFERVAVTENQILEYNLPFNPDEETEKKMRRDSKTDRFLEKYGRLYAVELDALPALIPEEFKQKLVIDKVSDYFDEDIYQELLLEYSPDDVKKLLKSSVESLAQEL